MVCPRLLSSLSERQIRSVPSVFTRRDRYRMPFYRRYDLFHIVIFLHHNRQCFIRLRHDATGDTCDGIGCLESQIISIKIVLLPFIGNWYVADDLWKQLAG